MINGGDLYSFESSLIKGEYNLFFGSGVSRDSKNSNGEFLLSGEELRLVLCKFLDINDSTSLSRAYALLSEEDRTTELIPRFCDCTPGDSVRHLPHFLWRRVFSLNIDDVIENLYRDCTDRKQNLIPINFLDPFEPTPKRDELHHIHLHGWVKRPDDGFVFSPAEYAQSITKLNPWTHMLSEILATEPFIICGTSLNEPDLEYFLAHRNNFTPRRGSAPSFYIHPKPDKVILHDCERFGLIPVEATFGAFMDWLYKTYPHAPTISDLVIPTKHDIFSSTIPNKDKLRFFSDFELVQPINIPSTEKPSAFFSGQEPSWNDIYQHNDIERVDNIKCRKIVDEELKKISRTSNIVVIIDEPGAGKTTTAKRVIHSLANAGHIVFSSIATEKIDVTSAINCLSNTSEKVVLFIDNIADHADQVLQIIEDPHVERKVVIFATERSYRKEILELVLFAKPKRFISLERFTTRENLELIESYRRLGLIGSPLAIRNAKKFSENIRIKSLTISICRILNDFKPLDRIVNTLWAETIEQHKQIYLSVALSQYCYKSGIKQSLLQSIAGLNNPVNELFANIPLRLTQNPNNPEYIVVVNTAIAERLLHQISQKEKGTLFSAFTDLAIVLAPYVNRKTIKMRTSEARITSRLLDYDKVIGPMLGNKAEQFYLAIKDKWEWNSRYWEQRALLSITNNPDEALQHARHAVSLEKHPYPLTTLGKVLFAQISKSPNNMVGLYEEAFSTLQLAIEMGSERMRETIHPYSTLLSGTIQYLDNGGQLKTYVKNQIMQYLYDVNSIFHHDARVQQIIDTYLVKYPELITFDY